MDRMKYIVNVLTKMKVRRWSNFDKDKNEQMITERFCILIRFSEVPSRLLSKC